MRCPKVSVVVPNYNHCRFLPERINSILSQSFADFEVIILDDASTDASHATLSRYYSKPQVRVVVNERNTGSAFHQWNRGIALAKGEYLWIAESDDSADPQFLETLVPLLDADPDLALAYCQSRLIDANGTELGSSLNWTADLDPSRWASDYRNNGPDELRRYLAEKNTIPNASAVLSRRSLVMEVVPIDASFTLCGDWLHWGKLLLRADVAYTARPLNYWRTGSSNSRTRPPGVIEWREGQRVIRHLVQELGLPEPELNRRLLSFADRCINWLERAVHDRPSS